MRFTTLFLRLLVLTPGLFLSLPALGAQQKLPVVNIPLAQELVRIFPDIANGYIDFSANGKPDQTSDINEYIPESRIRDGQLQAQEILDFLLENWRFVTLDKLKAVRQAVKSAQGAIGELIAIDFANRLEEVLKLREAMGDGLYLTPSALKEALDKMGGIISAMASAYKKEGNRSEADFLAARDSLFQMIDKGYPLPPDLPQEERVVLGTSMLGVVLKEQTSNPPRTRTAIRVLGLLKSLESAPTLVELASGTAFPVEAMKALGEMGYRPGISVIAGQLKSSSSPEVRKAAFQATGAIGGAEALEAILDLVKPATRENLTPDLLEASVQALAGIATKGNTDPRILTSLKDLAGSSRPVIRQTAAVGLGAFANPGAMESLQALALGDKDTLVRQTALKSMGKQPAEGVMTVVLRVLAERDLDPGLKATALGVAGDSTAGAKAVPALVDGLGDPAPGVRTAAVTGLKKLFPGNQVLVSGTLARALTTSSDEEVLVEGTRLLADLADPGSLPTLLLLLGKPQSEVKRLAAWALYRIRSAANPKIMDELAALVTNENETLAVRVTAVRALGAIGFDSPQLGLSATLVTTMGMRGEKYATLRYVAVQALGQLNPMKPATAQALVRIAFRDQDPEMKKAAVQALKNAPGLDQAGVEALAGAFREAQDPELKVRLIETLSDQGAGLVVDLGAELLAAELPLSLKRRVLWALSQNPTEASAALVLDAGRDPAAGDYITAVLESYPRPLLSSVVTRRLRSEQDKNILSVLTSLEALSGGE